MITTPELPAVLADLGAEYILAKQDRVRRISSQVIRFVKGGRCGVAVGADMRHRIEAALRPGADRGTDRRPLAVAEGRI